MTQRDQQVIDRLSEVYPNKDIRIWYSPDDWIEPGFEIPLVFIEFGDNCAAWERTCYETWPFDKVIQSTIDYLNDAKTTH